MRNSNSKSDVAATLDELSPIVFYEYLENPEKCPNAPHRGPQGPNEDIAVCDLCGSLTHSLRPEGETFGYHAVDCSLPERHGGYCVRGGNGHPPAKIIRG